MSISKTYHVADDGTTFTVPANIDGNVTFDVRGAQGGAAHFGGTVGQGGKGGRVTGTLTVNPGDVLTLVVGSQGGNGTPGSWGSGGGAVLGRPDAGGNGGAPGTGKSGGAGGGAASAIRVNGTFQAVIAAGGGGGANGNGASNDGGDGGGPTGQQGGGATHAQGGSQSAGGTGGAAIGSATVKGSNGHTNGVGGDGGSTTAGESDHSGGGGGGGYYGGGGGGAADATHSGGAGAGGSNYYYPTWTSGTSGTQGYQSGNGQIILTYKVVPNAPTLTSPDDGSSIDPSTAQQFAWTFNSNDASDSQSKFDLRYSGDGGVTWTTVTKTTPNNYYLMPGGTLANGSYQWQVRTYNSTGTVGPWSPSLFFTAAETPGAATITYPTSGGTVGSADEVDWSVPNQDGYQVQVLQAGTVVFDTGEVDDPDARSQTLSFATSGLKYKIQVRTILSGLWSPWQSITVTASFVPPPAPTVLFGTADPDPASGIITALQAVWTTPDPDTTSGQPAAQWVDLWLSTDGGATSQLYATELDIDGSWTFRTPASGIDYSVQAVAHANQSAAAASPWVR